MINISEKTVFYVACPPGIKTGGTELLHQLVFELNKNGKNTFIAYTEKTDSNPCPSAFEQYIENYKYLKDVVDDKNNVIIFPETLVGEIGDFSKIQIVLWWLSVDNFAMNASLADAFSIRGVYGIYKYIKSKRNKILNSKLAFSERVALHLTQSYYAISYLKKHNINNIEYLSDYINLSYLNNRIEIDCDRKNIVLYNPVKGGKYTKFLKMIGRNLNWKALQGMTNEQVKEALQQSKVYIDFGHHPGKDRFPREAAICGCCVITGKRGAARFQKDVDIMKEYKFKDNIFNGFKIIKKIKYCMSNYNESVRDFENYRKMILNEPKRFQEDVKRIFCGEQLR